MGNVFFKTDLLPKPFVAVFLIAVPIIINNSYSCLKKKKKKSIFAVSLKVPCVFPIQ